MHTKFYDKRDRVTVFAVTSSTTQEVFFNTQAHTF